MSVLIFTKLFPSLSLSTIIILFFVYNSKYGSNSPEKEPVNTIEVIVTEAGDSGDSPSVLLKNLKPVSFLPAEKVFSNVPEPDSNPPHVMSSSDDELEYRHA